MLKQPIKVYYTSLQNDGSDMHVTEPVPVLDMLRKQHVKTTDDSEGDHNWKVCPSIKDYYHNVFAVTAPQRLRLILEDGKLVSPDLTPENYNSRVNTHASNVGLFGISYAWFFAADTDSLMLEQLHPVMSGSDFSHKVDVMQGHLDCGKYFRPFEVAFKLKPSTTEINIEAGDALFYVKFRSDRPIQFVRAIADVPLLDFISAKTGLATRQKNKHSVLKMHYDLFIQSKARKRILAMLKERA